MSKKSLFRLSNEIFNTPHLITPQAFDTVLTYLEARNGLVPNAMIPKSDDMEDDSEDETPDDMDDFDESPLPVVVIDVCGTLTYKPVMTLCGEVGTSYQSLLEAVEDSVEAGATTIILNMSSGGGQASHVFEYCEEMRKICDEANVKLIAYVDEMACSAAYAIAVIADEVYANPSASVGSIGCVVSLLDTSKAMEMEGYKRIFITSGKNKVPFDEVGAFKESFLEEIQASVDKLNTEFCDFVSKYSGIDSKIIRDFEAAVFDADEALDKGLINGIMTNREFVSYVVSQYGEQNA